MIFRRAHISAAAAAVEPNDHVAVVVKIHLIAPHFKGKMTKAPTAPDAVDYEEPSRLQADLQHIREWLSKQPHLRSRTDDAFLLRFLRGCKYSLERTKEKIDNFYTIRGALPEFFTNRDPMGPDVQAELKLGNALPLNVTDNGLIVILVGNLEHYDIKKVPLDVLYKTGIMIVDLMFEDEETRSVMDYGFLFNTLHIKMDLVTAFTPAYVKKIVTLVEKAYPVRPKVVEMINLPTFCEVAVRLFKALLSEKINKRIHIHKKTETLQTRIPRNVLPTELGGEGGSVQELVDKWRKKLEENKDFFVKDAQYGVDEEKRPGKPKSYSDIFGMEGSFRQLNVD